MVEKSGNQITIPRFKQNKVIQDKPRLKPGFFVYSNEIQRDIRPVDEVTHNQIRN